MASSTSSAPEAPPPAHEGAHYDNPTSKSVRGPVNPTDRDGTQRVVWALFFVLMACIVGAGVVLALING